MRVRVAERLRECVLLGSQLTVPCHCGDAELSIVDWYRKESGHDFSDGRAEAADIAESIAYCEPPQPDRTAAPCGPLAWCQECARHEAAIIASQVREDRAALCR